MHICIDVYVPKPLARVHAPVLRYAFYFSLPSRSCGPGVRFPRGDNMSDGVPRGRGGVPGTNAHRHKTPHATECKYIP